MVQNFYLYLLLFFLFNTLLSSLLVAPSLPNSSSSPVDSSSSNTTRPVPDYCLHLLNSIGHTLLARERLDNGLSCRQSLSVFNQHQSFLEPAVACPSTSLSFVSPRSARLTLLHRLSTSRLFLLASHSVLQFSIVLSLTPHLPICPPFIHAPLRGSTRATKLKGAKMSIPGFLQPHSTFLKSFVFKSIYSSIILQNLH